MTQEPLLKSEFHEHRITIIEMRIKAVFLDRFLINDIILTSFSVFGGSFHGTDSA